MQDTFTCPNCGLTSSNPNDVKHGYCGNCHDYTGYTESAASMAVRLIMRLGDVRIRIRSLESLLELANTMAAEMPLAAMVKIMAALDAMDKAETRETK